MPTEQEHQRLRERITQVEEEQIEDRRKHIELREWVLEGTSALKTEVGIMKSDIHHIRKTQDQIVSGVNRVVIAIVLAFIGGLVTVIIKGDGSIPIPL